MIAPAYRTDTRLPCLGCGHPVSRSTDFCTRCEPAPKRRAVIRVRTLIDALAVGTLMLTTAALILIGG